MKIAVATQTKDENGQINEIAGRAPYFLVFDGQGNLSEVVENIHADKMGGAGINAAELLAGKDIDVFIAGNIGPKMAEILETEGVRCKTFSGSIKEAVDQIIENV